MLDTLLPQMYNKRPADVLGVFEKLLGLHNMSASHAGEAQSGILAQVEVTQEFLEAMPGERVYDSAAHFLLKVGCISESRAAQGCGQTRPLRHALTRPLVSRSSSLCPLACTRRRF